MVEFINDPAHPVPDRVKECSMKKLMIAAISVVAVNAAANVSLKVIKASGGTLGGALFLAAPILRPAPLTFKRMVAGR